MRAVLLLLLLQQLLPACSGLRRHRVGDDKEYLLPSFDDGKECPSRLAPTFSMVKVLRIEEEQTIGLAVPVPEEPADGALLATLGAEEEPVNSDCADVTHALNQRCSGSVIWAFRHGKNTDTAANWYADMLNNTGMDYREGAIQDFQRRFFCAAGPSADSSAIAKACALPPCTCSSPPCNVCGNKIPDTAAVTKCMFETGDKERMDRCITEALASRTSTEAKPDQIAHRPAGRFLEPGRSSQPRTARPPSNPRPPAPNPMVPGHGGNPRDFTYRHSTTRAPPMYERPRSRPGAGPHASHRGPPFRPYNDVKYVPENFKAWKGWEAGPAAVDYQTGLANESNASLLGPGWKQFKTWLDDTSESKEWSPSPARPKLAIMLTGLLDRLLLPELLRNVVAASGLQGYDVDIFASFVVDESKSSQSHNNGYLSHFVGEPMFEGMGPSNITQEFKRDVERVGGRVARMDVLTQEEDIDPLPEKDDKRYKSRKSRFSEYSPYFTTVGKNVLRRYKTLNELRKSVEAEAKTMGKNYTWVLEIREDLLWITPLNLTMFTTSRTPQLYAIDCLLYGGLNDKALLYNQEAASLLGGRYDAFYHSDDTMLDDCSNAESFLGGFMMVYGIQVTLVPVRYLGAVSAMYRKQSGELEVCVRKTNQMLCLNPYYMPVYCDPLDHTMQRKPAFCSDIDM